MRSLLVAREPDVFYIHFAALMQFAMTQFYALTGGAFNVKAAIFICASAAEFTMKTLLKSGHATNFRVWHTRLWL